MTINITPRLIDLTYEALLKSYWRKEALRKFLISSRISSAFMDASHLYLFFSGVMSFQEIISRIRRHASQTGQAYLPVSEYYN